MAFSQVEEIFACYDIPKSKKVKLAATNLRGKARSWWEQLKIQRLRKGKTKIHTWEKMKQKLREQFLAYNYSHTLYSKVQIQDVHFLQNGWTVSEAFNRAVLIENHQVKGAQSVPFNSKISARSGDATSNFTKKVENGSNVAKSSKASKVPAKNLPILSKGETLVVEEIEDQDFLVKELEDQDIGHLVFNSYIEEQNGEGGQELTECIISMVESVHGL